MSIKGKYPESTPVYIALLAAGFAAAVVVFIIVYSALSDGNSAVQTVPSQTSASTTAPVTEGYTPDEELSEEMKDEAQALLVRNYQVLKLYYTRGLPHLDEPYGNAPEDGYYTVDSDEYDSLAQLEELVDSTFCAEQAETVKTNPLSYGPIYKERSGGALGIIENFTPMPYNMSWDNPTFSVYPVSDDECEIALTIHDRDTGEGKDITGQMVRTEDGWRLVTVLF